MASTSKAFNKCVDPCPRYLRWHTQSLRLLFGQGARMRCPWGENLCATSSTFAGRRHMIGKVVTGCVAILLSHRDTGSWIWVSRFRFHIAYRYSPTICTMTYWSRAWSPPFVDWATGQYYNMITTTALLKKVRVKGDGLAKHVSRHKPYWASVRHPQMEGGGAQGL